MPQKQNQHFIQRIPLKAEKTGAMLIAAFYYAADKCYLFLTSSRKIKRSEFD